MRLQAKTRLILDRFKVLRGEKFTFDEAIDHVNRLGLRTPQGKTLTRSNANKIWSMARVQIAPKQIELEEICHPPVIAKDMGTMRTSKELDIELFQHALKADLPDAIKVTLLSSLAGVNK